jgi:hypothetical protein
MIDPQLPGQWKEWTASFTTTNGTQAKVLADVTASQVLAAISGETAQPGESAVRQRVLTGGQRVIDGGIASTDGTARSALLYVGKQSSLYANMGTVTITATNVLNRTTGSFITDGYKVGDAVMVFGSANGANDGVRAIVTGVTTTTLTVNGTPWANTTEAAGFRVFRVIRRTQRAVAINAGNADATPPTILLGGTQDPQSLPAPDTGLSLDADGALIVAMTGAISALPATVEFHAIAALY